MNTRDEVVSMKTNPDKKVSDETSAPVKHWKSLEEWEQSPEFLATVDNEFMSSPMSEQEGRSSVARRDFLKFMGASIALSSAGCIRRPVQKIIPYVNRPKDMLLGVANYYTSTLLDGGEAFGLVVKTREGRPIKLEGNTEHPVNAGGLSSRAQSHVLGLYDPDRLRAPKRNLHNEKRTNRDMVSLTWAEADKEIIGKLEEGNVAVLTETLASPSTEALISEFTRKFGGKYYVWDSMGAEDVTRAHELSYGSRTLPSYHFDKANFVVSVGADFMGTYLSPVEFTKQWSKGRNPDGKMNRLVVYESMMSLTGANSDERFRIKPSQHLDVVTALIRAIVNKHASQYSSRIESLPYGTLDASAAHISQVADELWANKGQSLVIAGGINTKTKDALALQVAVNFLNHILGNDGRTITGDAVPMTHQGSDEQLVQLIEEMKAGRVNVLVMHKVNPAYFASSPEFVAGLQKVGLVVYAGEMNESAMVSDIVLPANHDLENWGDAEFKKGVFSIKQPTIRPLYESRAFEQMLMTWMAGEEKSFEDWYQYVRAYWRSRVVSGSFDAGWDETLQKGFYKKSSGRVSRSFRTSSLSEVKKSASSESIEWVPYQKVGLGDGRAANLSWLQELPDPVTKVVWDNYVCVSPKVAKEKGLKEGSVLKVSVNGNSAEIPVHIQPGLHDEVFALAVGYGRWGAGKVANGVGVNASALSMLAGSSVAYAKTRKMEKIANTQGHHTMFGRPLVADTTYGEYQKDPTSGKYHPHFEGSIWDDHKYPKHKWGMVIDTNSCTGCSACVTACQAENNIPVVGKKYVLEGREMHWLRIDRYYSEDPTNPETVHQPLPCQHCDNAPCETVCPVIATTHSDEGINEMTYNRCVGTRYCANNCPYKVRRFNWFSYLDYRKPTEMVLNPEVQVRSRGVMEKCSFCVQRIKEAKNVAKDEKRDLGDNEVKTACQQSCPADAIVFGDVNNPNSDVAKWMKKKRSYSMLEDLNTKPAVQYLTKVRHRDKRADEQGGGH